MKQFAMILVCLILGGCETIPDAQYPIIAGELAATTYVSRAETRDEAEARAYEVVRVADDLIGIIEAGDSQDLTAMLDEYFALAVGDRVLLASVFAVAVEYVRATSVLTGADVIYLQVLLDNIAVSAEMAGERYR